MPTKSKKPKAKAKRKKLPGGFDSEGEQIYYERFVSPGLKSKKIKKCEMHAVFEIIPQFEFDGKKYRKREFKPDFVLTMADKSVVVVEVKSKYVRHAQRDYPLRRNLFLLNYCVPNGWKFEEVSADEMKKLGHPQAG